MFVHFKVLQLQELRPGKFFTGNALIAIDSVVAFDVYNSGALLTGYLLKIFNTNGGWQDTQTLPITPYPAEKGAQTYLHIDLKRIPYTDGRGAAGQYFITAVSSN